jgi:hypothetical protein
MNSKLILCLALVLSCGLFGCSTSSQHSAAAAPPKKTAGETDWRITLRAATTNAAAPWMHPFSEPIGTMNYTVPGDAAKILESRPTAELLPFLAKLRMEPPPWKAGIVDEWIAIVRDGLHGRPGVIAGTFTTAKGVASTNEIPISSYTEHFVHRTRNNQARLLGTNIENSTAIWELSQQDIQDITNTVQKQTFQRVATLGRLTKTDAWVMTAAPAWDTGNNHEEIDRYRKETNGWTFAGEIGGMPLVMPCEDYLFLIGPKLGCYFTLEYRSYKLTRQTPRIEAFITFTTNDLAVASTADLVSNLRRSLDGFIIEQDVKNPKVIHIIEGVLEQQKDYVLKKRTNLSYSGNLVNCNVIDAQGRNLVHGEGIVNAMASKVGGIQNGTTEAGSQGAFDDCFTVVNIEATNEMVRSILTDYIPLAGYKTVLWRAVTTVTRLEVETNVLVQFYGPKLGFANTPVNHTNAALGSPPDITNTSNH